MNDARLARAASIYTPEDAKKFGVELHYVNTACDDPVDRREESLIGVIPRDARRVYKMRPILESVFDAGDTPGVVDTYVHNLRKKTQKTVIRTVHGVGYQLGGLE